MTSNEPRQPTELPRPAAPSLAHSGDRHGGHGWMMIACCIPMLLIAVVLVTTGAAGVGFLGAAIACTVMMTLMMRGMDTDGHDHRGGR
jgi:hypothetical protein